MIEAAVVQHFIRLLIAAHRHMRDLGVVELGFQIVAFDDTDLGKMRTGEIIDLGYRLGPAAGMMEDTDRGITNRVGEMKQSSAVLAIGAAADTVNGTVRCLGITALPRHEAGFEFQPRPLGDFSDGVDIGTLEAIDSGMLDLQRREIIAGEHDIALFGRRDARRAQADKSGQSYADQR